MERRSERYSDNSNAPKKSRVDKNRVLYDEINSKIGYEEISVNDDDARIDLSTIDMKKPNRENYQKIKEYKDLIGEPKEEIKEITPKVFKPKEFDINKVLEEAKRNRKEDDDILEKRRNIQDDDYNVLSSLNKKYLYKKEPTEEDSEELKELIDTITSKTLADDIKDEEEKELLSDLLATTIDIKLEKQLSQEDINKLYDEKEAESESEEEKEKEEENTFYTGSMELSKEDLVSKASESDTDSSDELDEDDEDLKNSHSTFKIVFISFILLLLLAALGYFVLKQMGIL